MQSEIEKTEKNIIYNVRFSNLTDLYNYLKSNPPINRNVYLNPSSMKIIESFYGESLEKSIEYCISGYKYDFDNFLKESMLLKNATKEIIENRKVVRSLYNGAPLAPLVAAGVPDCMISCTRDNKSTVRNIYFNLAYPHFITDAQIINRGIITLYLIQTLEERGEIINFHTFDLSYEYDFMYYSKETINIEINLKKPGDLFLDIEKCYFPIRSKEFLRRIMFRVQESIPVKYTSWQYSYGKSADEKQIRSFYNLKPTDIVISNPTEMGINGNNLYEDTLNVINKIKMNDEFNTEKIKKLIHK